LIEDEIRPIVDKNGSDVLVNVNLNGKRIKAKIHEVQRKPVSDEILHVDLMPWMVERGFLWGTLV